MSVANSFLSVLGNVFLIGLFLGSTTSRKRLTKVCLLVSVVATIGNLLVFITRGSYFSSGSKEF